MRVFNCPSCSQVVFFENTECVRCGGGLAYDHAGDLMTRVDDAGDRSLCLNRSRIACNWTASEAGALCVACKLTRTIPIVDDPLAVAWWAKLETAKRRLVQQLTTLGLPLDGLAFDFLQTLPGQPAVMTGHDSGVITINIAEADDARREQARTKLGEPYRTLLGHLRHEVGHYYWGRIVEPFADRLAACRDLFGDDRADYADALKAHYDRGLHEEWQGAYISRYAASHPYEDWAESFAHYLHMHDLLETAAEFGVRLHPPERAALGLAHVEVPQVPRESWATTPFDQWVTMWQPVTIMLNSLNRGMGLPDSYPFAPAGPALAKVAFVHESVRSWREKPIHVKAA